MAAPRRVMDAGASFVVSDILADREARVPTFGLDNALSPRYPASVKTGTSKDMRDNWCVGYSARYTVGVWVGNASGEPMWDVSGVSGAAPVWRAVMDHLERTPAAVAQRPLPLPPPKDVVARDIRFDPAVEPPRSEWFIAGTEQAVVTMASSRGSATTPIQSPTDGSIIAFDPDIPPQSQQLRLAAASGTPTTWRWRMDGKPLGRATTQQWAMWPGRHTLELIDERGAVKGVSRFDVRGVYLKEAAAKSRR
jgi:penicillin-binding protein 1C